MNESNNPTYWVARLTEDAFDVCVDNSLLFANAGIAAHLKRLRIGDVGVFFVSKRRLNVKVDKIQEFRKFFHVKSDPYQCGIQVDTLPIEKQPAICVDIEIEDYELKVAVPPIVHLLSFVKNPIHWGSYFMTPFIEMSKSDFDLISKSKV